MNTIMIRQTLILIVSYLACIMSCYGINHGINNVCYTEILKYIKNKSHIKEGGCDLFNYKDNTYVIGVASVVVGNKTELNCKKVGTSKAKKEIISYINGSEVTSYTELVISESSYDTLEGNQVEAGQEYVEKIKEKVFGVINQCTPLGGWYSEDGSVYYYAIFKLIE